LHGRITDYSEAVKILGNSSLRYILFRKEKCTEEDTDNAKEVKVPDDTKNQANTLEIFHKMVWLQNQNIHTDLGR
jgi:hypothetical protein